jgi:hypothetical protein
MAATIFLRPVHLEDEMKTLLRFTLALVLAFASQLSAAQTANSSEGQAELSRQGDGYKIGNGQLRAELSIVNNSIAGLTIQERRGSSKLTVAEPFAIIMKNGVIYSAANLKLASDARLRTLEPRPAASRIADQTHGKVLELDLTSDDGQLHLTWSLIALDGTDYLRQSLTIHATEHDLQIEQVKLIDLDLPEAKVVGSVAGSPIVAGNWFFGIEDPLSVSKARNGRAIAWVERELPLRAGQEIQYSAVFGVADPGQLRRAFLAYIETERAHPYRTFLHYNSWYDLGYFTPYSEKDALDRIDTFGRELVEKRGVKLDSFLFDDGWDNHHTLWGFNEGFPNGFAPLKAEAQKFGAAPGVWMSPWGGYSKPKDERIAFGRANSYEIVNDGYALSGPKYYDAFRNVAINMMSQYGVNQFKFDGTGNVDSVFKGSRFDSDFAAMQHLIGELRAAKPDLFVNLTTGTWPSPFWLMYADSIWRGGEDDSTAGVGPYRERWITYRDADTYKRVVLDGPLYPLNSLMLHGLIFAQHHRELKEDPQNSFQHEVRSYFGTGTQLQEMYITPSLLSQQNWDDLAGVAKWSRANADVLKDSHWIGGNPAWLEVYGWAAWSPKKSIITLRNPSDHEQKYTLHLREALELPRNSPTEYYAHSPWANNIETKSAIAMSADIPYEFHLQPFEVLTLDIGPQ